MYRLKVKCGRTWRWGLNSYTLEQAISRQTELNLVGIKSIIKPESELFN